ncbi:RNA polymerase sigma factor [uncultured Aquimonas sp.]|uniref:RNA polymerase sigma factor n=1 Tax=uncultured Aquimonas sp. TaxID=385483 RepID=UPI00261E072E|nr:RNA polymerase sigma factor [uncultured Aquimonas sp.]
MSVEQTLAHIPHLRRYARLLTGDASRADDLVQDTLERACVKWALWQPGTALRSWLLTLMHNLFLNQRRDWRHDDAHASLDDVVEASHEPFIQVGEQMDMRKALARMSPALTTPMPASAMSSCTLWSMANSTRRAFPRSSIGCACIPTTLCVWRSGKHSGCNCASCTAASRSARRRRH